MSELLSLLKKNSRETPENLAKMMNITVEEVKKQISELEENGIIRAYQVIINEEKLDDSAVYPPKK